MGRVKSSKYFHDASCSLKLWVFPAKIFFLLHIAINDIVGEYFDLNK